MKDIKSVSLVDRRGYLTVALEIGALTPQQFTTSTISNYHWYFVRHCRERKYSNDSTCISFFRWWDGRAGAAEAGGSPWLVQPRAEAGQCDTSVTQVWHQCDTSVTPVWHKCDTSVTQVWHKCDKLLCWCIRWRRRRPGWCWARSSSGPRRPRRGAASRSPAPRSGWDRYLHT